MGNKADCYLIDAVKREIRTIPHGWTNWQPWLPGGLTIGWMFSPGDVLYVDDQALLRPVAMAFRIRARQDGQPMMSHGILCGREEEDFENDEYIVHPPSMTPEELLQQIEWLDVQDALVWFRERANAPAVTRDVGGHVEVLTDWRGFLDNLEGRQGGFDPHKIQW